MKSQHVRDLEYYMNDLIGYQLRLIESAVHQAKGLAKKPDYIPTCPCGCDDCVMDPAYIRDTHLEWWEELDMPTECDMYEVSDDGEIYCCHYDDEDK